MRALLRTAREVATALQHLGECNVVHGDLKPGNVLLGGSRSDIRGFTAALSDFGLSCVVPCMSKGVSCVCVHCSVSVSVCMQSVS